MATDVQIANLALRRLGANTITSLTDGSRNATVVNDVYTLLLYELLRSHPWNFATRRAALAQVVANTLTITAITQANPGVLSYTGSDPSNGDKYDLASIVGMTELNGEKVTVQGVSTGSDTFQLYDEDGDKINTTSYTAYVSGGTATEDIPRSDVYSFIYSLPGNFLRVVSINDNPDIDFVVDEYNRLLCNEEGVEIVYLKNDVSVSYFSSDFVSAFAARIAAEVAQTITGDMKKMEAMFKLAQSLYTQAIISDAREAKKTQPKHNPYVNARR